MKILVMALTLLSTSAFAQTLEATAVLNSVLPTGIYQGKSPEGNICSVYVQSTSRGVVVAASSQGRTLKRVVEIGSSYRMGAARYFLSSDVYGTNDGFNENTLMTRAVTEDSQYVVVADRVVVQRESFEHKVECIVNL